MKFDNNRHTKFIEVPQERVWMYLYTQACWAYVWEDGYDALAYVKTSISGGCHWWTTEGKSGFTQTVIDAIRATGYDSSSYERWSHNENRS